jgi:glucosamine kinase
MMPEADLDRRGESDGVIVGIDAGGSSTRARAMLSGATVYEGIGGPGNPLTADPETVRASYYQALASCPAAAQVAACVAGAGSEARRAQIAELLAIRFPGAQIRVEPDHVAAFLAAPAGTDACIMAGTGSAVCSRAADGTYQVSGGRGWILGDHGGAARLGRAVLERFVDDPSQASDACTAAIRQVFGDDDWRLVIRSVHTAPDPAPLLARFAPLLTEAAESRTDWAVRVLDQEMLALATTAARHIDRYIPAVRAVHIALAGGVWRSPAARSSLTAAVKRVSSGQPIVTSSVDDPVAGALRLAGASRDD